MSYAYRYLRLAGAAPARPEFAPYIVNPTAGQYAYQDYKKGMPFSAWDVDANPPRRLAVGFLENNVALGMVDGCWWPIANGVGQTNLTVREWFFIFDMPYTGATPDTVLQKDIFNRTLPIMWWGLVNRRNGNEFPGPTGLDQFLILSRRPPSSSDVWTFNPTILVGVDDDLIPYSFALSQNYPNPFNPSTTIHYTLPAASNVTLNIYNILGQKVRTLVNEQQIVGEHVVRWDGTNDAKRSVATGVYFYRIEIKASDRSEYTMVKKMLLLK